MRIAGTTIATMLPGWPLALFRIAFGLMYLDMALQKSPWVISNGHRFGWLYGFIEKQIAHPTFGWYIALLEGLVLPNFTAFGAMTFVVEMALGIGLLLGLFTRLAGLAALLWQVNIALGAYNVPGEWYWIWPLLTFPPFCFAFSGAGRALGLDAWLEPALRQRAEKGLPLGRFLRYTA